MFQRMQNKETRLLSWKFKSSVNVNKHYETADKHPEEGEKRKKSQTSITKGHSKKVQWRISTSSLHREHKEDILETQ